MGDQSDRRKPRIAEGEFRSVVRGKSVGKPESASFFLIFGRAFMRDSIASLVVFGLMTAMGGQAVQV